MADVLSPTVREVAQSRRRRSDLWVAATAMVAAVCALPLAQSTWHGPEVAAVLAVSATALFAGQRWAIAVIVIAELMLLPTIWPRAFLAEGTLLSHAPPLASLLFTVPGILAMRRAAAALALIVGFNRTRVVTRRFQVALGLAGLFAAALPLL